MKGSAVNVVSCRSLNTAGRTTRTAWTVAVSKYFRPYWHPSQMVLRHLDSEAITPHPSYPGGWCGVYGLLSNCLSNQPTTEPVPAELGQWVCPSCPRREEET